MASYAEVADAIIDLLKRELPDKAKEINSAIEDESRRMTVEDANFEYTFAFQGEEVDDLNNIVSVVILDSKPVDRIPANVYDTQEFDVQIHIFCRVDNVIKGLGPIQSNAIALAIQGQAVMEIIRLSNIKFLTCLLYTSPSPRD